jgi:purine nucleoside permease
MQSLRSLAALASFVLLMAATAKADDPAPVTPSVMPEVMPKVMIVSMFGPEGEAWRSQREFNQSITVPGLSPDYPNVRCGADGVCLMTTGMGYANAASSISAVVYSPLFDLRRTYWLIAGIAGVNPHQGTLGSAAWARYLVDWGLQWELDGRDVPKDWPTGYLGINTRGPAEKPPLDYRSEVFHLNDKLVGRAMAVSRSAALSDSPAAQTARAAYPPPGNQPPSVLQCDTLSGDTWFSGTRLGERAEAWTKLLTDGQGVECMTAQEDNASFEALTRGSAAHRADIQRVAVLRTGSDFDRPAPGGSEVANLLDYQSQGGFDPAVANLYLAGNPLVQEIVTHWSSWEGGVPQQ